MANIVLLGPPGAGKGTQSEKITHHYKLIPIVPGNLMREHVNQKTSIGMLISNYINEGMLAPHKVVMDLVEAQVKANKNDPQFLFDGFPRAISQATSLDQLLPKHGHQLDAVIFLEVPDDIVRERIRGRAKTLGRVDDQGEDRIARRLHVYQKETLPVIDYYEKQNKLYRVKGVGPIEEVFKRIMDVVKLIHYKNQQQLHK